MSVWKKMAALAAFTGVFSALLGGCAGSGAQDEKTDDIKVEVTEAQPEEEETAEAVSDLETTITWWTYPVFVQEEGQEDGAYEQHLIQEFNKKYPNITVELRMLDYTDQLLRKERRAGGYQRYVYGGCGLQYCE